MIKSLRIGLEEVMSLFPTENHQMELDCAKDAPTAHITFLYQQNLDSNTDMIAKVYQVDYI